jgi:DNA processing protein
MRPDADTAAWLQLGLLPGLAPSAFRALLKAFGPPREILRASRCELLKVVSEPVADRVASSVRGARVDQALAWLDSPLHSLVTFADATYPRGLLEINDPPAMLYVRGDPALLSRMSIAIVGSRNATPQGRDNAESFARALSHAGVTIVSGFAAGIDAAAHRGGLEGEASTVAVLGTGADIVYPRSNAALAAEIEKRGAIMSEFPLGTPPVATNFPRRNRLISALSRGCLVVEAAPKSGSLITAKFAAEQGRDVFAIPGSIHSPLSHGCHELIRDGAKLVQNARDVLEEMALPVLPKPSGTDHDVLDPEPGFLQYMGYEPCDIDRLMALSGLTAEAVSAMLLKLELEGRVGSLPGGLYQLRA